MKRRDFLKIAGTSLIMGSVIRDLEAAETKEHSVVAVSEGKDYAAITKNAIGALGGISHFVKKGSVVVVKPNIGWDRTPDQAGNTHPMVVKAVVEECLKAGAKKVKVFDRSCNDARRCYTNSGVADALRNMKNVDLKHVQDERFKKVAVNGVFIKEWELYDEALSADVFINVPIAKHHKLTRLTLGLKNIMGIMGGDRGYIHRDIETAISDINTVLKSRLVIIDATRILTDHGPQGGDLKDVKVLNKVIASADIVAADAYATTLFGLKPDEIKVTVSAYKRGLGEMDLKKIHLIKA